MASGVQDSSLLAHLNCSHRPGQLCRRHARNGLFRLILGAASPDSVRAHGCFRSPRVASPSRSST
jgi:hypothetical protein